MHHDLTLSRAFAFAVGLAAVLFFCAGCGPLGLGVAATLAPGLNSSTAGECPPDCCQPNCPH